MKNLHKLLNKLAWDFSQEQFDHLLECIQVDHMFCSTREAFCYINPRLVFSASSINLKIQQVFSTSM